MADNSSQAALQQRISKGGANIPGANNSNSSWVVNFVCHGTPFSIILAILTQERNRQTGNHRDWHLFRWTGEKYHPKSNIIPHRQKDDKHLRNEAHGVKS